METTNVRIAPRTSRVPLDDVLIELRHEALDDRFHADAVNIGIGGLSMRAAVLPDVGSRLRCSFQSPADGEHVEAGCEVVWAADSGRYMGEFGLRFTEVDPRSTRALRKLVADWSQVAEPDDLLPSDADADVEPTNLELRLDGVASPLVAELVHDARGSVIVEQELPFLRLGTGVEAEDGRRGRLHAVDLRLDGELPRLVLTVRYDGDEEAEPEAVEARHEAMRELREDDHDHDHDHDHDLDADAARALALEPRDALDTIPDAPVGHDGGFARPVDDPADLAGLPCASPERDAAAAGRADEVEERRDERDATAAGRADEVEERRDERDASPRDLVGDVRARLVPAVDALRAYLLALWGRLVPAMRRAMDRTRRWGSTARAQGGPMLERSVARAVSTMRRFFAIFRGRNAKAGTKHRVQTRRVQASRGNAQRARDEDSTSSSGGKGRKALLAAVTLPVLGLGAYGALASDGAPTTPDGAPSESTAGPSAPAPAAGPSAGAYAAPAPAAYAPAPSAYGAAAPGGAPGADATYANAAQASAQAPSATPEVPRALPEPDYEAGPMPAPTYPAMGEAGDPGAARPSAGAQSFGATSVPGGAEFQLNMSTPIRAIHGQAAEWGFTVRIPGSLALSPARPIAQNHPHVEQAAIRNLGDAAELTIRFVEGRNRPYRVEARGASLRVIIGR